MLKKIALHYLKKQIQKLSLEEECLEIHQENVENVDFIWQKTRQEKITLKQAIDIIESQ